MPLNKWTHISVCVKVRISKLRFGLILTGGKKEWAMEGVVMEGSVEREGFMILCHFLCLLFPLITIPKSIRGRVWFGREGVCSGKGKYFCVCSEEKYISYSLISVSDLLLLKARSIWSFAVFYFIQRTASSESWTAQLGSHSPFKRLKLSLRNELCTAWCMCWELNSSTCTHVCITSYLCIHIIKNNKKLLKKRQMELAVRCDQAYHKNKGSFVSLQHSGLRRVISKVNVCIEHKHLKYIFICSMYKIYMSLIASILQK